MTRRRNALRDVSMTDGTAAGQARFFPEPRFLPDSAPIDLS
jgi:hypothetical protein